MQCVPGLEPWNETTHLNSRLREVQHLAPITTDCTTAPIIQHEFSASLPVFAAHLAYLSPPFGVVPTLLYTPLHSDRRSLPNPSLLTATCYSHNTSERERRN